MAMFFKPAPNKVTVPLMDELTPLAGELSEGSIAGVITTDLFSQNLIQYSSLAGALNAGVRAYYIDPSNGFSVELFSRFGEGEVLVGKVYSAGELVRALEIVEENSFVFVSNFSILGAGEGDVVGLRRLIDEKGLYAVFSQNTLELNELNLNAEYRRLFVLPELYEYLIVIRSSSYRGHYRLNVSLSKLPALHIKNVGEHSITVDEKAKLLMGE
ncbi:hypothetical protein [Palaeococcus ferrophilus]|uniref:hypothetical protein n=1 Tax=Palaeococcus ferrophilus TaxID=83868 RepID=UPI001FE18C9F|nr:hypothetical protein [Palaeococcus ferrophilus]